MKCKACKTYDKKEEEALEEFETGDPALEYRFHYLKINRDIDCTCTCDEAKIVANEALNSQMPREEFKPKNYIGIKPTGTPWNPKAENEFHNINSSFPTATTVANALKTDWTEKSKEEILADIKILNAGVKEREEELTLLFEQLDVIDISEETRAILKRMRSVFSEDYPLCKISPD